MVKISILYPNEPDGRFDMDYYVDTHMPMSIELVSAYPGFKGASVERGLGGEAPDSAPPYVAMCYFLFDSFKDFTAAFTPHAETLQENMARYTDIEAVIQVSEVALSR